MSDGNRYGGAHVLLAFLAGTAAGAAVALMASKEENRERLAGWGRDVGDRAAKLSGAARDALGRAGDAARQAFVKAKSEEQPELEPAHEDS